MVCYALRTLLYHKKLTQNLENVSLLFFSNLDVVHFNLDGFLVTSSLPVLESQISEQCDNNKSLSMTL